VPDERKPRRPGSHHDHTRTPSRGVPDFQVEDPTPPPIAIPRSPTPDRLERELADLRAQHNQLVEATWTVRHLPEQVAKMDRTVDKIDGRLDGFAERVVRAEDKGDAAWDTAKSTMPKLDQILTQLSEVKRLADGVEKLGARGEAHDKRLSSIETEQQLAAQRFDAHDKRDQLIEATVDRIESRVGALETDKAIGDATAKQRKLIARVRPWWWSAKGVAAVLGAMATAAAAIIAAAYGG
jgi:chromosome segregation ATPase